MFLLKPHKLHKRERDRETRYGCCDIIEVFNLRYSILDIEKWHTLIFSVCFRATKITNAMKGMPERIIKYEAVRIITFIFNESACIIHSHTLLFTTSRKLWNDVPKRILTTCSEELLKYRRRNQELVERLRREMIRKQNRRNISQFFSTWANAFDFRLILATYLHENRHKPSWILVLTQLYFNYICRGFVRNHFCT